MARDIGHHGPDSYSDLRGSQSYASRGGSHGVKEVGDQRQGRLVDLADGRRGTAQPDIGQAKDRAGSHDPSAGARH